MTHRLSATLIFRELSTTLPPVVLLQYTYSPESVTLLLLLLYIVCYHVHT